MKQIAIDRTMQTYGMIHGITPAQEQAIRAELTTFMQAQSEADELKLTIAGLQFLRARSYAF